MLSNSLNKRSKVGICALWLNIALLGSFLGNILGYTQLVQTTRCADNGNNANGTCSPDWCVRVPNWTCDMEYTPVNIQPLLNTLSCRQCTQSKATKCSQAYFDQNLKKTGGLGGAYCNDKYLVLMGDDIPVHSDGLASIPRPPGYHDNGFDENDEGGIYDKECIYRTWTPTLVLWSSPLFPQILPNASLDNNAENFYGQTDPASFPGINLPGNGPMGVSVSGQEIFPIFNNAGYPSHSQCEMDRCNAHSAGNYHYHGDPFSDVPGDCMYSPEDYYEGIDGHPPVIGWSFDGFDIYGRHLSRGAVGFNVSLDLCGGHQHDDSMGVPMPYHYHTQVVQMYYSKGGIVEPYFAYVPGPFYCWRGNISVAKFFGVSGPLTENRVDYNALQPCCEMESYYLAPGISFSDEVVIINVPTSSPTPSLGQPTMSPSNDYASMKPSPASTAGPTTLLPSMTPSSDVYSYTPTMSSLKPSPSSTAKPTTPLPTSIADMKPSIDDVLAVKFRVMQIFKTPLSAITFADSDTTMDFVMSIEHVLECPKDIVKILSIMDESDAEQSFPSIGLWQNNPFESGVAVFFEVSFIIFDPQYKKDFQKSAEQFLQHSLSSSVDSGHLLELLHSSKSYGLQSVSEMSEPIIIDSKFYQLSGDDSIDPSKVQFTFPDTSSAPTVKRTTNTVIYYVCLALGVFFVVFASYYMTKRINSKKEVKTEEHEYPLLSETSVNST